MSAAQGKHALKTGVAGVLAICLARLLHLPQAYWAAVSAVLVTQSDVNSTLKAGGLRMAGTAIAALVSVPFAMWLPGSLIGFGAAVVITMALCAILELEDSERLAAACVVIIMLIPRDEPPWMSGLFRFLEVSFGIGVSASVARLLWPVSAQPPP